MGRLAKVPGKNRFVHERWPFCRIHAIENEFGLWAYRCPSERCLRRRFIASGGWLNVEAKPEDTYVYVPLEGTLDDEPVGNEPSKGSVPPVNSDVKCPRCGVRMRPLR